MIALVVVYCLKADPAHCIERRDALTSYDSMAACTSQAEIAARDYLTAHPKWMLTRWRCEMNKPEEAPA